jgi:Flp pilus assembly protein TadG
MLPGKRWCGLAEWWRKLAHDQHGATALEFAFVVPLLLLLLLGTIDLGRLLWTRAALDYAVAQAARCMAVSPQICGDTHSVAAYAARSVSAPNVRANAFHIGKSACGIEVRARYRFVSVAPNLIRLAPVLNARACSL